METGSIIYEIVKLVVVLIAGIGVGRLSVKGQFVALSRCCGGDLVVQGRISQEEIGSRLPVEQESVP